MKKRSQNLFFNNFKGSARFLFLVFCVLSSLLSTKDINDYLETMDPNDFSLCTIGTKSKHANTSNLNNSTVGSNGLITSMTTIIVTNTNNAGAGSLRQAITDAQSTTAADIIEFNILGSGVHTITPTTALPIITRPLLIDGSTQPGYAGTPLIEINATNIPTSSSGIYFANNSNSGIKALCINRAPNRGVFMVNGTNMTIEDCIIGMDATGLIPLGNGGIGVSFIGNGLVLSGSVITNNQGGQFQNVSGSNIEIRDNIFGLDITGTIAHTTTTGSKHGVEVRAAKGVIIENNIISGHTGHGLLLAGAGTNLEILNNKIGTDITGNISLGNGVDGISLSVYTPVNVFDNVIGGSGRYGIIASNNNLNILRNSVGIGVNGADIGNNFDGIYLQDQTTHTFQNSQVGDGTIANANYIAFNGKTSLSSDGIAIRRISSNRIPINTNIIHSNASIGIDLQVNGVSGNDVGDGDVGANDFLNFPVINSATLGSLIIDFDLDVPAGDYRMEVYGIPAGQGDPTTHGEGNTYLGTFNINHTGSGVENFVETMAGTISINAGDDISMTTTLCTDATCTSFEVTSEFSQLAVVETAPVCDLSGVIIKKVGAPTICEILTANPTHPIGALDCDGGGKDNLTECNEGLDPTDPSDDAGPPCTFDFDMTYSFNDAGTCRFYVDLDCDDTACPVTSWDYDISAGSVSITGTSTSTLNAPTEFSFRPSVLGCGNTIRITRADFADKFPAGFGEDITFTLTANSPSCGCIKTASVVIPRLNTLTFDNQGPQRDPTGTISYVQPNGDYVNGSATATSGWPMPPPLPNWGVGSPTFIAASHLSTGDAVCSPVGWAQMLATPTTSICEVTLGDNTVITLPAGCAIPATGGVLSSTIAAALNDCTTFLNHPSIQGNGLCSSGGTLYPDNLTSGVHACVNWNFMISAGYKVKTFKICDDTTGNIVGEFIFGDASADYGY